MTDIKIIKAITKYVKSQPELYKHFNNHYVTQKYSLQYILKNVLFIMRTGLPWRDLNRDLAIECSWNTIYKAYCKLIKLKIIKNTYIQLLQKYFRRYKNRLKYRFSDTSTITVKHGGEKAGYNKYAGRKKCCKLSLITDKRGIAYSVDIAKGNANDTPILENQLKQKMLIELPNNCIYFMADKGYDSKALRTQLHKLQYSPLIPVNKRNTKYKQIPKMSKNEKRLFRLRIKIEHTFMKLKRERRIATRYDRYVSNYIGFVFLGLMKLII